MTTKHNRQTNRSEAASRLFQDDPMPFGKYQGIQMKYVPESYLLFLHGKYMEEVATGKEIVGDSHRVLLYVENFVIKSLKS